MKVNVNHVLDILSELKEINEAKLEDIEFIKDGQPIPVSQELIKEWEYVGLNTVGFITHEYYIEENHQ